jgi:glycosyltransferase involved in cell wall biosynthesis
MLTNAEMDCATVPEAMFSSARRTDPLDIRHVIFDIADEHPSAANGLHCVAAQLALEQQLAGDSAELIFLSDTQQEVDIPAPVPVTILPLRGVRIGRVFIRLERGLLEAVVAGATSRTILHIHGARQPLLIQVARHLRQLQIPYVVTVHSRYAHLYGRRGEIRRPLTAAYASIFERPALTAARFVHVLTAQEGETVRRVAPRARIEVLANAAYSSRVDGPPPAARTRLGRSGYPVFGFCGRLAVEHKGLDLLIEGFAKHRLAGGLGRLVVIGTGNAHEELRALSVRLGVGDAVSIQAPIFGEEKKATLRSWDYFVMPSRFDHMPLGAIEAALLGLPLIVTSETGLVEPIVRRRAGIPIRALDASSVADSMREAASVGHDGWVTMSRNSARLAVEVGDWTAINAQLRTKYVSI